MQLKIDIEIRSVRCRKLQVSRLLFVRFFCTYRYRIDFSVDCHKS